jgi:hypothetical protein
MMEKLITNLVQLVRRSTKTMTGNIVTGPGPDDAKSVVATMKDLHDMPIKWRYHSMTVRVLNEDTDGKITMWWLPDGHNLTNTGWEQVYWGPVWKPMTSE